ncbi:MAG: hypothetical protein JWM35_2457 [Verrucomicrobia bacterium]|nr:hypothetical protein [Verrucomicrobiota bacterium]
MKRSLLSVFVLALATTLVAANSSTPNRLYAAVGMTKAQKNSSIPLDSGVYVRGEDGQWTIFGPRVLGVSSIAMSPADPRILLVAAGDGVVRSADGGKTWRRVTGWEVLDVRKFVFDVGNPSLVYAATSWGLLRSTDAGATWQVAEKGLARMYCQTIIADAAHPGRVLLGAEDGVYVSTDAARSWRRASFPTATVLRLAQSPADPRFVVAGTQGKGVWLSRDGGKNWSQGDPATATANLYAAAISPHDAAKLATGGWGTSVRVSLDGGRTWTDRSAGLPVRNVFVLAFDPDRTERLWASTFEEGAFYSDDLGATWHDGGLYGSYGTDFVFLPPTN